jgi:hypothetical protein
MPTCLANALRVLLILVGLLMGATKAARAGTMGMVGGPTHTAMTAAADAPRSLLNRLGASTFLCKAPQQVGADRGLPPFGDGRDKCTA